jgi:cytochrome c biogenesis protein CcdA/peroxiredoxin
MACTPSGAGDEARGGAEAAEAGRAIHLAFFEQPMCTDCGRAQATLEGLETRHPEVVVETFDIYEHTPLALWLAERAGHDDFVTPAVFVGDEALVGADAISTEALEEVVRRYEDTGAPRTWTHFDEKPAEAELVERFQSFGPLAVVLAGLLDGINPCAFATIIFFVSYLTLGGRRGRVILAVGAAFTFGVFSAYLAVGLGLYRAVDALSGTLTVLGRIVLYATAVACLVLAGLSFRDAVAARRGKLGDMVLVVPSALERRIRSAIRTGARARTFVLASFVVGLVVSLLELACTGQVYLPTIIFVSAIPELRARAIGYLVLYNLVFILPLVVIVLSVYFGTTSQQLVATLKKRAALVKVALGVLFTGLALWLVAVAPAAAQGLGDVSLARSLIGSPAPVVEVTRITGRSPTTLLGLRGRVVVLDFFSTFCGACRDASASLDGLERSHGPRGLSVIGISRDPYEHLVRAQAERPNAFTVTHDESGATFQRYHARYLPTQVLIDRRGIVREVFVGSSPAVQAQIRERVEELLREPARESR